jgi:hypothetical protein
VRANRWSHMLAEGVHRPIPCRTDGKWLPNAGPEQPRGGGERPGLPPALLRKRCLSSCLNAAAVDPRSQAHAALRCPSLSLLGPSCCEAHGSLGDQVWRWLSAEGAENGHFAFLHAMQLFTASSQSPLIMEAEAARHREDGRRGRGPSLGQAQLQRTRRSLRTWWTTGRWRTRLMV